MSLSSVVVAPCDMLAGMSRLDQRSLEYLVASSIDARAERPSIPGRFNWGIRPTVTSESRLGR
jgi:hypothetical protein